MHSLDEVIKAAPTLSTSKALNDAIGKIATEVRLVSIAVLPDAKTRTKIEASYQKAEKAAAEKLTKARKKADEETADEQEAQRAAKAEGR